MTMNNKVSSCEIANLAISAVTHPTTLVYAAHALLPYVAFVVSPDVGKQSITATSCEQRRLPDSIAALPEGWLSQVATDHWQSAGCDGTSFDQGPESFLAVTMSLVFALRTAWLALRLQGPPPRDCDDGHASCPSWARAGECFANPSFMRTTCRLSCATCAPFDDSPAALQTSEIMDRIAAVHRDLSSADPWRLRASSLHHDACVPRIVGSVDWVPNPKTMAQTMRARVRGRPSSNPTGEEAY